MNQKPDVDFESKKDFLAHIDLGLKPEYELVTEHDFEFISHLGVHINRSKNKIENLVSEKIEFEPSSKSYDITINNLENKNQSKGEDVSIFKDNKKKSLLENISTGMSNLNNMEIIFETKTEKINQLEINEDRLEENRRYQCFICNQSFTNKVRQREHLTSHLRTQQKITTCPFCGKPHANENELSQHFTTHLTKQFNDKQCKICLKKFSRTTNLKRHINAVHNMTNSTVHNCEVCFRTFENNSILKQHLLTHSNKKEYHCNICQKSFRRKYHLSRHLTIHTPKPRHEQIVKMKHKCHICNKSLSTPTSLRYHMSKTHRGQRDFKCKNCPKEFSTKYFFEEHVKRHDLKFACPVCCKDLDNQSCLRRHLKTHIAKRDFKCRECTKEFMTNYYLRRHMIVHTRQKKLNA